MTASQPKPARVAAPHKGGGRRIWFNLHSWVGLKLSVFMAFVCLTGTLAVLAHEIDWLMHPEIRVAPGESRASWGEQVAAIQRAHPEWRINYLAAPHASRFAAKAATVTPQGRYRYVWVDPHTGQVTGDTHWFNAHRFLRNAHRHLMMPVWVGVPLVSALAIPLLLSLVSSLYIYKRWWRGLLAWPRRERRRRFWGDVHRLLGVWSLWFVLLIALTGLWYLVESLGAGARPLPEVPSASTDGVPSAADPAAIDRAVDQAHRRWPELEIRNVYPSADGAGLVLDGQAGTWLVRERANAIGFDLRTGAVLGRREGSELDAHQRISEMADPLHFGSFGGWPVRLLWFLFGAALTALSVTGVYLYGLRVADAMRSAMRRGQARTGVNQHGEGRR